MKKSNFKREFTEAVVTVALCSATITAMNGLATEPYWYIITMLVSLLAYIYILFRRKSVSKYIVIAILVLFCLSLLFALDKIAHLSLVWCTVIDFIVTILLLSILYYKTEKIPDEREREKI